MRIVIDMQGLQTSSRFRGIGRYSLSLVQSLLELNCEHEIFLLFNGRFLDSISETISNLRKWISQEQIKVWYAEGALGYMSAQDHEFLKSIQIIREGFVASLNPDIILLTSLFEGFQEDAVTSINCFDHKIPVCTILYDLIPLLNENEYFKNNVFYEKFYKEKLQFLKKSTALLTISELSRQDGLKCLTEYNGLIENISIGIDKKFTNLELTEIQKKEILSFFGVNRPPIICVGGCDERKNLFRLLKAYALLPETLRIQYPLVLIGNIFPTHQEQLLTLAKELGIQETDLYFLGQLNERQLVEIYNVAFLLISPSLYEGVGLTVLEATACGIPVLCSDIPSFRDIYKNHDEIFFNPHDEQNIADVMYRKISELSRASYSNKENINLANHYSWDNVAAKTYEILQNIVNQKQAPIITINRQLKLAYISPMPPEKTGIGNYSEELLNALKCHYDITVICLDENIKKSLNHEHMKNVDWFLKNYKLFDRVLYHFGNSCFHLHMLKMLPLIPGVVVLHDFFLSNLPVLHYIQDANSGSIENEIWYSHGYTGLLDWLKNKNLEDIKNKYPINLEVLQHAKGIITHSYESIKLAKKWYGDNFVNQLEWDVIPLLRELKSNMQRQAIRDKYGISPDTFIVSSFGLLDLTKLNLELLLAWFSSSLSKLKNCKLIFVGENHGGEYGRQLKALIKQHEINYDVEILGWVDDETFNDYLMISDVAVQLRTLSRGETSSAVLSCLAAGLPTIVNGHGAMSEISSDCVYKLDDEFTQESLIGALESLKNNQHLREHLSLKAITLIKNQHAPECCAQSYFDVIERNYATSQINQHDIIEFLCTQGKSLPTNNLVKYSKILTKNFPVKKPYKRVLLDVTATFKNDLKTGIERVVRALVCELIQKSDMDIRFEPVFLCNQDGYRYRHAQTFVAEVFGLSKDNLINSYVDIQQGDKVLILDNSGMCFVEAAPYIKQLQGLGVEIQCVIYDLLPIFLPHVFPPGTDAAHQKWLDVVLKLNGVLCISEAVANEFKKWALCLNLNLSSNFKVKWFHLGADIENSSPSLGIHEIVQNTLKKMKQKKTFLVVSTIEPRKRHLQIIEAFEYLWKNNKEYQLVIVGREGWKPLPNEYRRNIPETMNRMNYHPEKEKRLFYLDNVSDEALQKIYQESTCLILASEGEGFGLPIIEAAQYKIPMILRDIPVFKEIAKENAFYFSGMDGIDLANAIEEWELLYDKNLHPQTKDLRYLTWQESAIQVKEILMEF